MNKLTGANKIKPFHLLLMLAVAAFCPAAGYSQKLVKEYVKSTSVPIRTIAPDSVDFSDLEPIGNAIGDAKVVMLGEQDHGDAPTFLAKTRLIKYLHEKKGFNVLAFESDFFGLNYGWDRLKKTQPEIDTFLQKNIFPIWTVCQSCDNLFYNYIPATYSTGNPLIISGFDSQQYLWYSYKNLKPVLDSVFREMNLPITHQNNYVREILPLIDSPRRWIFTAPKDTVKLHECLVNLYAINRQMTAVTDSGSFWRYVMDNLLQQAEAVKTMFKTKQYATNERDTRMAKNLAWLNENKFKNQKIIVWAADAHVAKSLKNMKQSFFDPTVSMGDVFVSSLKNNEKVYVLGFTSYKGVAGRLGFKHHDVYAPRGNGFETWLNKDYPYAFVDFDGFNKLNPDADEYFFMKALGHLNYEGKWYNVFDGIFFIRDMYPCERNGRSFLSIKDKQ